MSFLAEQIAIESYFKDNWTYTPIAYENVNLNSNSLDEWVRLTIRPANPQVAGISGSQLMYRYKGVLFIQIFVREGIGSGRAIQFADYVSGLFRSKYVDGIHFGVPAVTRVGSRDSFFQVNVDVGFYREEFE